MTPDYYTKRMEAAFEERIEKLTKELDNSKKENRRLFQELSKVSLAGKYYLRMQKHILEYEAIGDAWKEFLTIYVLAIPKKQELEDLSDDFDHSIEYM